ncbi:hypothetical protein VIGAN_04391100, partial [Vigna angularis var. angularis]
SESGKKNAMMNVKKNKRTASITILPTQQEHRSCQILYLLRVLRLTINYGMINGTPCEEFEVCFGRDSDFRGKVEPALLGDTIVPSPY